MGCVVMMRLVVLDLATSVCAMSLGSGTLTRVDFEEMAYSFAVCLPVPLDEQVLHLRLGVSKKNSLTFLIVCVRL
jgi:hypothetical protein